MISLYSYNFQLSDSPVKALSHLLLPSTQAMDHLLPSGEHYKEIKEDLVPFRVSYVQ